MKPASTGASITRLWLSGGITALLSATSGLALFLSAVGGGVVRFSYDLPFALRSNAPVTNAVVIFMDEVSHKELNQPFLAPWDRTLHAQLIEALTTQGARAIVFDVLFSGASGDSTADERFVSAARRSGRVFLAGTYHQNETLEGAVGRWEEVPYEPFAKAAAGWGNANFLPDADYGIRRFFPTCEDISGLRAVAWLPETVARAMTPGERLPPTEVSQSLWLNYYGPPGTIPHVSYFQALMPEGVPPGFFKDKIVFVGAQLSADFSGKGKDEFMTPYTYWGRGFAPGVEIHTTAALNMMRGDWLRRFPFPLELAILCLVAVAAGCGLVRLQSVPAAGVTFVAILAVALTAHFLAWRHHLWFAWLLVIWELAVALLCAVIYNSLRLYVEKRLLEESLAVHLSPALVKRMLSDPALRRRGGVKQEVSMLFTDMENFSRISETMNPDDLVDLLNRYFQVAIECIHAHDGTVMDLVGDAIFAIWNAPVEQTDHRERAWRAALDLRQRLLQFSDPKHGLLLRTRVGLHTGVVCVGNIGSAQRFDYTAVGENTNLASRIEGLNKHLGSTVLASRDIQKAVEGKFLTRLVGHFQVKGFARPVELHDFIGPAELAESSRGWRGKFAEALQLFRSRQFDAAEKEFHETIRLRMEAEAMPGHAAGPKVDDGPSRFYLDLIAKYKITPPPADWIGEVSMKEK